MTIRLNKATRDLNVGITTVVEFLQKKGYDIQASPNAKITEEQYAELVKEFSTDKNLKKETEKKAIDKKAVTAYIDVNDVLTKLSDNERKIVLTLQKGPRLVDDVIAETGLTTGKLLSSLTMLELKGIIKRLPGKRIELKL